VKTFPASAERYSPALPFEGFSNRLPLRIQTNGCRQRSVLMGVGARHEKSGSARRETAGTGRI
jgi:hypothetical protein